jgi:molybdopterin molybdotransferase
MGRFSIPEHSKSAHKDVRMRGFQDRTEVGAVTALLQARLVALESEIVNLGQCSERVLAADIRSEVCVPNFDRSAMDGFALIGSETFGASTYNPLEFHVIGEALPGRAFADVVHSGQAVRIMTGAPLPEGADAVLQAEAAEERGGLLRVSEPVPPGRHVGRRGEDIEEGTIILHQHRVLRPQDLGVLASIGHGEVAVIRRPSVEILVTGNELLPCGSRPRDYQIVDSNSVMLAALVKRDGGIVEKVSLIRDNHETIRSAIQPCTADVLLTSGGTSVGEEDHAPSVLAEMGELAVHGVALRPASPTGVGFLGTRPFFLLPGNPVSCLCAYDLFAGPAIRRLGGRSVDLPYLSRLLPLARKISSVVGRVDYVRVVVHDKQVEPLATSGASMLTSTTRADGFVLVPADSEGHAAGEDVRVFLYDSLSP